MKKFIKHSHQTRLQQVQHYILTTKEEHIVHHVETEQKETILGDQRTPGEIIIHLDPMAASDDAMPVTPSGTM